MRYLALAVLLAACSPVAPSQATDAAQCEPRVHYACGCGDHVGVAACNSAGELGACECAPLGQDASTPDAKPDVDTTSCEHPVAYYPDADGDGFGAVAGAFNACTPPGAGYVTKHGDCDDSDPRAFPGQTAFFDTISKGGGWDFDCDGTSITKWSGSAGCTLVPVPPSGYECRSFGMPGNGWSGSMPGCGTVGQWFLECVSGCGQNTEARTQACR